MAYKGGNPDLTSTTVLNLIRDNSSDEYKARVPQATQDNLKEVGDAILNYTPTRNEFLRTLYNKVGLTKFVNRLYENPLKMFKTSDLNAGDTIEEIYTGLVKATIYDPKLSESEVWKRNLPDIQVAYHQVNRRDKYNTTVQKDSMKSAFATSNPIEQMASMIVGQLTTSNNYDEFMLMKQILVVALSKGLVHTVQVPAPTNKQNTEDIVVAIKEHSSLLTFMDNDVNYNYANVEQHTPYENQVLIVTAEFKARYDVSLLAQAFNMTKAEFEARVVEVNKIGETGVIAMLMDERFLLADDYVFDTDEIWNPDGRYMNFWLHVWQTLSSSPFRNCIAFIPATPTIDSITIEPATATVKQGFGQQFIVEAQGNNYPSAQATFTVERVDAQPLATYTGINSMGFLVVDDDEAVGDLTVTATSVIDGTKTDTSTVTVVSAT